MMTDKLHTDEAKLAAIVGEWLDERPALAHTLQRTANRWRIRADLEADGLVTVSIRTPSGASLAVWRGPRSFVEREMVQ